MFLIKVQRLAFGDKSDMALALLATVFAALRVEC